MNYSSDTFDNKRNLAGERPPEKSPNTASNLSDIAQNEMPAWFIRLFFAMLISMILALWLIPDDILVRWSMWWNNIPLN